MSRIVTVTSPKEADPKVWVNTKQDLFSVNDTFDNDDCDCDCSGGGACSTPVINYRDISEERLILQSLREQQVHSIKLDQGVIQKQLNSKTIALSTFGTQVVVFNDQVRQLIPAQGQSCLVSDLKDKATGYRDDIFEKTIAVLLATGILVSPQYAPTNRFDESYRFLTAWLHLTNQCNLKCSYCYVKPGREHLDIRTARKSVEAVFRAAEVHGFGGVKLKYAGGEPTLNFKTVIAAQRHAEELRSKSGTKLLSVILTNGFSLTQPQISVLKQHDIRVAISLDGIGVSHDRQRPAIGGTGSFHQVKNKLDLLLSEGIKPHITATITRYNISCLSDLIAFLLERQLSFNFNFYRNPTDKIGVELNPGQEALIIGLKQAFRVIEENLPSYSLFSGLADRANLQVPHLYTCGVGHNYIVIDCQGNIAKCQMEQDFPVTTIDTADPLSPIRDDKSGLQNISVEQIQECRDCIWRYRCTGGCPRVNSQQAGQLNKKSPLCKVYRTIFPDLLKLEALRLLKYEEPLF